MLDEFVHRRLDDNRGGTVPGLSHVTDQWDQCSRVGLQRRCHPFDQVRRTVHPQRLEDRIPKIGGNTAAILATSECAKGGHPDPIAASLVPQVRAPPPDSKRGAIDSLA